MAATTTIRIPTETRDRIRRLAELRGVSTGELVDRAADDALFADHAAAYERLRRDDADLLREIESEDRLWEQSDLTAPTSRG